MKLNFRRVLIFFFILLLSVGVGIAFDSLATAIERASHPMAEAFREEIKANAEEFGLPEYILWGLVRTQSNFSSNKEGTDGSIGLTQLTPEEFETIHSELLKEPIQSTDMLYAPKANLRAGSAYLSYLYHRYGVWETAFAAYEAGSDTVDTWLSDPALLDERGTLETIPDPKIAELAKEMQSASEMYRQLYFEN